MSVKRKRFIVISLSDTESWGYNEETLPMLIYLVDFTKPDARMFTHTGVIAYYLSSKDSLKKVESVIDGAESLRDGDKRFSTLGIGLGEGEMIAEFDWKGRIKEKSPILGDVIGKAVKSASEPNKYREILLALRKSMSVDQITVSA